MAKPSRENLVRYAQEANEEHLLTLDNVIGVGTGYRMKGSEFTDEVSVQVFVERKVPLAELRPGQAVPNRVAGFEGANIRTDVIQSTPYEAQQDTARYRPVQGGISIGAEARTNAGTLGGWACDDTDNTTVLLSNNHVISNLDTMPTLRRIVQPGRFDGGTLPGDVIGRLKRHMPLNTVANPPAGAIPTSVVDAAIGSIDDDIDIDHDVIAVGPAIYEVRAPALGMNVRKRGRTTLHTTNGRITTVGATFRVTYRNRTRISRVQNTFQVTSTNGNMFSDSGDSGSLIFDQAAGNLNGTRPVVGLLFAGGALADGTPVTLGNDINAVFGALNLSTVCTCVARALIRAIFGSDADAGEASIASRSATTERNLRKLRGRLADSKLGSSIDELVTREAASVGRILASDDQAFADTVEVLAPLRDRLTGPSILDLEIDDDLVGCVTQMNKTLARHDAKAARELRVVESALKELRGNTVGQILDLGTPAKKKQRKKKK